MNLLFWAILIGGGYYLWKQGMFQRTPETLGAYPTLSLSVSTPVVIGTADPGQLRYSFTVTTEWTNANPISDIIIITMGENKTIGRVRIGSVDGRQRIPVEIKTVPSMSRTVTAILKNISGVEYVRAVATESIMLPGTAYVLV